MVDDGEYSVAFLYIRLSGILLPYRAKEGRHVSVCHYITYLNILKVKKSRYIITPGYRLTYSYEDRDGYSNVLVY